jgi:hypothetical protein
VRGAVRIALIVAMIAVTIGGVLNVFADDAAVRSAAEVVACPRGCKGASSVQVERSPIAETVDYEMPGGIIHVRCIRAAVLFGPYTCVKD